MAQEVFLKKRLIYFPVNKTTVPAQVGCNDSPLLLIVPHSWDVVPENNKELWHQPHLRYKERLCADLSLVPAIAGVPALCRDQNPF